MAAIQLGKEKELGLLSVLLLYKYSDEEMRYSEFGS